MKSNEFFFTMNRTTIDSLFDTEFAYHCAVNALTTLRSTTTNVAGFAATRDSFQLDIQLQIAVWDLIVRLLALFMMGYLWLTYSSTPTRISNHCANRLQSYFVTTSARIMVSLVEDKELHKQVQDLMADGLNEWFVNPNTQKKIRTFVNETPVEEAAFGLGQMMPLLIWNFHVGFWSKVTEIAVAPFGKIVD